LEELDPNGRLICELIMQGCPERTAAEKLGLSRNTYVYRRDKLLTLLREALRDYI
jgi:FixJ family two-component response regulator